MELNKIHSVYFLGIGGIGMSALALYFIQKGVKVFGYDRVETPLTKDLVSKGAIITYVEDVSVLPSNIDLTIYTPAVPRTHAAWEYMKIHGIPMKKRAEVLGIIAKDYKTIGVAGTHGKTTISTMIAYILSNASVGCNAFLGGLSKNFDSNLLLNSQSAWMVVEADEFDRSFLQLHPWFSIVSSTDADHLDIYGDRESMCEAFAAYISQTNPQGISFIKQGLKLKGVHTLTYHLQDTNADYHAENIYIENGEYVFDLITPEKRIHTLRMSYPGLHNIENAIIASAVSLQCGILETELRDALYDFKGVKRRFDCHIKRADLVYIDDYAHHPNEIRACIGSLREFYPTRKITAVFQPHLYTRTRDFAEDFADSLSLADELILLDIYPARELPIEGINSELLKSKINRIPVYISSKENLVSLLQTMSLDCLVTMGAGDIDTLVPCIEKTFKK